MRRELTWDDVIDRLESLDFSVTVSDTKDGKKEIELEKYSDAGQDCIFNIECDADSPSDICKELSNLYENYDPEEETMLWLGPDGHGKNGAPYSMRDLLHDMESVEEDLKNTSEYMDKFVSEFGNNIDWNKDEVKGKFLYLVFTLSDNGKDIEKDPNNLCREAYEHVVNDIDGGSPVDKKKLLLEYLTEIGITDEKPETFAAALTKAVSENKKDIELFKMIHDCGLGTMKTTTPMMSSTEVKVHRMFDELFNRSETNPYKYGHYNALDAMGNNFTFTSAVAHLVNSGGSMWQSTYDRVMLLEKHGLIHSNYEEPKLYGPCYDEYVKYMNQYGTKSDTLKFDDFREQIFPHKNEMTEILQGNSKLLVKYNNYYEKREEKLLEAHEDADKTWGKYMHMYLKDLGVFNEKGRLEKKQAYENKHGYEGGR